MKWRGFLIESKEFTSYGTMPRREKVRFWTRFPGAYARFVLSGYRVGKPSWW